MWGRRLGTFGSSQKQEWVRKGPWPHTEPRDLIEWNEGLETREWKYARPEVSEREIKRIVTGKNS